MRNIFVVALLFLSAAVSAQKKNVYRPEMVKLQNAIQQHFYDPKEGFYKETAEVESGKNPYSFLWPLCALIQADNEIEKLEKKGGLIDRDLKIIREYYDPSPPAPGYASYIMKYRGGDRFYDDNQWIGIACLDANTRNTNKVYQDVGKDIYKYMMTGYDTVLGGGIYWQENKKISKNTCSNGPGVILALQLYNLTKEKKYLDTALRIYNWVNNNLQAGNTLYYDNMSVGTKRLGRAMFSYNTGTMLQSNVYLYEITGKEEYLEEARVIADSATNYFLKDGKFRDGYWFNAVLLRGYQHLYQHTKNVKHLKAFKASLDNALLNHRDSRSLMVKDKAEDLVAQAGMLEILARFAYLEEQGIL